MTGRVEYSICSCTYSALKMWISLFWQRFSDILTPLLRFSAIFPEIPSTFTKYQFLKGVTLTCRESPWCSGHLNNAGSMLGFAHGMRLYAVNAGLIAVTVFSMVSVEVFIAELFPCFECRASDPRAVHFSWLWCGISVSQI